MPRVVCVTHSDPRVGLSGVDRYLLHDGEALARLGFEMRTFFPARTSGTFAEVASRLERELDDPETRAVVVHQVIGWSAAELATLCPLLERRASDLVLFFHDLYALDPHAYLTANPGVFPHLGQSVDAVRAEIPAVAAIVDHLARAATRLVVPSEFLAERARRRFAALEGAAGRLLVVPHLDFAPYRRRPATGNPRPRLAYLGYPATSKGWEVFLALAAEPRLREQLDFFALGARRDEVPSEVTSALYSYHDGNPYAAVSRLHNLGIDVVLLWASLPESYSYTAMEAHAAGVPVLTAPTSGNVAELVRAGTIDGRVVEDLAALRALLGDPDALAAVLHANPDPWLSTMTHRSFLAETLGAAA